MRWVPRCLPATLLLIAAGCDAPAAPYVRPELTPRVLAVTPNVGSVLGGAPIRVTVEGITIGAVLRFGPTVVGTFDTNGSFVVPGHAAGSVDVIVDNLNGRTGVLAGGFTYVDAGFFDFNGTWQGYGFDQTWDDGVEVRFVVEGNVLTQFSCGIEPPFVPASIIGIDKGTFSHVVGGLRVSGHLVADGRAAGRVDLPGCRDVGWSASRR